MAANGTSPTFTYDRQLHYDYEPLTNASENFRLFQLYPLQEDGVIRGATRQYAIDRRPHYIALSYEWGPAKHFHWIEVDGCRFQVRLNLFKILTECVRRGNVDRPFFVDAMCIDQSNSAERNAQVRLMSTIYKKSSEVSAWLTVFTPYVQSLFNFLDYHLKSPSLPLLKYTEFKPSSAIPRFRHGATDDEMQVEQLHPMFTSTQLLPTGEEICLALGSLGYLQDCGIRTDSREDFRCLYCELLTLMTATYWSRVWILPEFVLGRDLSINCMESATNSSILSHAVDVFMTSKDRLVRHKVASNGSRISYEHAYPVGLKVLGIRQKWRETDEADRAIDIRTLIGGLGQQQQCANDKDRIYSLLGLDPFIADFAINYTYSRLRLFLDVVFFLDKRQKVTMLPHQGSDQLLVSWRTLESCYPLTSALKLQSSVHTSDLKRDIKQFETDRQGKVVCRIGRLQGIELISTRDTRSESHGFSEFELDRETHNSERFWFTNVQVRTDDRFIDVDSAPDLGVGVVLRFNGLDWQFLATAFPQFTSVSDDKYEEKEQFLRSEVRLRRLLALGTVRHVGHTLVYDLGLFDAVGLHLLLGPAWVRKHTDYGSVNVLPDDYHGWYGPD